MVHKEFTMAMQGSPKCSSAQHHTGVEPAKALETWCLGRRILNGVTQLEMTQD